MQLGPRFVPVSAQAARLQQPRRVVTAAASGGGGGSGGGGFGGGAGAASTAESSKKTRTSQRQRQQQARRQRQLQAQRQQVQDDDDDDGGGAELGELRRPQHVIMVPGFAPQLAARLRASHDEAMGDPRRTSERMFAWHRFVVQSEQPGAGAQQQYSLTRTQAAAFFPPELHAALVDALLDFGERELGCRAVSPVWLSCYTEGDHQGLHVDSYHGPFAFVFSLTQNQSSSSSQQQQQQQQQRPFTGGETLLLKPALLDGRFWGEVFTPNRGLELADLVDLVPAPFGQLTVFDPRLPHGVAEVRGTRDPMLGRLVLSGWFSDPSPVVEGALGEAEAVAALDAALAPVLETLRELPRVLGLLTARVVVRGGDGGVASVSFTADTLVVPPQAFGGELLDAATVRGAVQHTVRDGLLAARFPPAAAAAAAAAAGGDGDTRIVLPLLFE